jgi:hypothetical protein
MRTCKLFDKYRDKELSQDVRTQFEAHLAVCLDCQTKKYLIDNIAFVLKQDEAIEQPDMAERIAWQAFARRRRWDSLVISWLRPGPALATLTLSLALFSLVWVFLDRQTTSAPDSEYESLISDTDLLKSVSASQVIEDNDFIHWLQQGRSSQ